MNPSSATARLIQNVVSVLKPLPRAARVLVVDDEPGVRRFISRVLTGGGYEVQTAASGTEALEAIDGGATFDLIVSDVRMPGMSGPRFIEQFRRQDDDTKVLYLTGYSDQLFAERETLWLDEAFLDKPCTVKGLLESVALLLHGRLTPRNRFTRSTPRP